MTLLLFVLPAVLAAVLAYALTPLTRPLAFAVGAVDRPGPRKVHDAPTPRLGGVAVVASVVTVLAGLVIIRPPFHLLAGDLLLAAALGVLPVLIVSAIDDVRGVRVPQKFAAQFLGASIAVALGVRLGPVVHLFGSEIRIGWLAVPISIVWLVGVTNAFNLIDGLDGLSSGLALISAISLSGVSLIQGRYGMAGAAAVLAGALIGFLPHNVYPARVYLGDLGATAIGFFLGVLTLGGGSTTTAGLAVTLPMVVVGLPVAEALVSMLRRFVRKIEGGRAGLFAADRDHFHHRLLALGLDHRKAVFTLYGVGLLIAGSAFASLFLSEQNAGLLLMTLMVAALVGLAKLRYDEFAVVRKGIVLRFYDAPALKKSFFVVFVDLAMVVIALYSAIVLKYDDWGLKSHRSLAVNLLALLPAVTVAVFAAMALYRRSWRQANVEDLMRSSAAVVVSSVAAFVICRLVMPLEVPPTFFVVYTLVLFILVNGSRASYRVLQHSMRRSNREGELVVIYGAGKGGVLALREILTNDDITMRPIGFIDDDPAKIGRLVNGYPVIGDLSSLAEMVMNGRARGVVIASEKIPIARVRDAKAVCEARGGWMRVFQVNFATPESER